METWKIDKVKAISDEVNELHSLLRDIFSSDPSISRFEYTHGKTEMGADFVLARPDPTLGDESYVGVIAKIGSIKQDYTNVKRQIEECNVERFFEGGKKKIFLSEIWITCNGSISNGAERKIHEEFKSKNIKFIDIDKLCKLVDTHASHYWNEIPPEMGKYLRDTLTETIKADSFAIVSTTGISVEIQQGLLELQRERTGKKFFYKKSQHFSLEKAINNGNSLILIEGGMGSGKSTMFRKYIMHQCEPSTFQREKLVPQLIHYSAIAGTIEKTLLNAIQDLKSITASANAKRYVVFIDGIDEVRIGASATLVEQIAEISNVISQYTDITVVLGSRPTWTLDDGEKIFQYAKRYKVLPLTINQIYEVIQQKCSNLGISERLRQDLGRSTLLRALPRTPMSALLLARVLSADSKEIPQTLPELYSKYIELALGRWDIGKGLMTEREYPVIILLLSKIAKYMLDNQFFEIAVNEVISIFEDYIKTRGGLPNAQEIFKKISQRSEIVYINTSRNTFSFRHKSFAEYLLAFYQKEQYGKAGQLNNPFEGYWLGVEYFYLGLIQDAGSRIDELSALVLTTERQKMLRILNFGNLMLAAFQTEYKHIEKSVYNIFFEMTKHFLDVKNGKVDSLFSNLSEIHFFSIIIYALKDSFEYDFFKNALESAQLYAQCDTVVTEEERPLLSFFIDSVRAGLDEHDVFEFLSKQEFAALPWIVKLGIKLIAEDEKLDTEIIRKITKKIAKTTRNNQGLSKYIKELYEGSMRKSTIST